MRSPTSLTSDEDAFVLLNAYLDNELDTPGMLAIERRISEDQALRRKYDRLVELKAACAAHLVRDRASPALQRRVRAIAETPATRLFTIQLPAWLAWRQMSAAAIISAALAAFCTYAVMLSTLTASETLAMVAGHRRALLASAPYDIASSDRHTVKPWFDGKLALSPQIMDFAAAGFPLQGGRIDIVAGKPVPVMIYQRRGHVISVIAVPHAGGADTGASPERVMQDGYTVLSWDGSGFRYSAVSDLALEELSEFVSLWRKAAR